MGAFRAILFLGTFFTFIFPTLANADAVVQFPPAQISCYSIPGHNLNQCEGFDKSYFKVTNRDSSIPRTAVVLHFVDGMADYYGNPEFTYTDGYSVAVLGAADFSVKAKVDDSAWVKKVETYHCTIPTGHCPIYKN